MELGGNDANQVNADLDHDRRNNLTSRGSADASVHRRNGFDTSAMNTMITLRIPNDFLSKSLRFKSLSCGNNRMFYSAKHQSLKKRMKRNTRCNLSRLFSRSLYLLTPTLLIAY
jgi:hypothetical protein